MVIDDMKHVLYIYLYLLYLIKINYEKYLKNMKYNI